MPVGNRPRSQDLCRNPERRRSLLRRRSTRPGKTPSPHRRGSSDPGQVGAGGNTGSHFGFGPFCFLKAEIGRPAKAEPAARLQICSRRDAEGPRSCPAPPPGGTIKTVLILLATGAARRSAGLSASLRLCAHILPPVATGC